MAMVNTIEVYLSGVFFTKSLRYPNVSWIDGSTLVNHTGNPLTADFYTIFLLRYFEN